MNNEAFLTAEFLNNNTQCQLECHEPTRGGTHVRVHAVQVPDFAIDVVRQPKSCNYNVKSIVMICSVKGDRLCSTPLNIDIKLMAPLAFANWEEVPIGMPGLLDDTDYGHDDEHSMLLDLPHQPVTLSMEYENGAIYAYVDLRIYDKNTVHVSDVYFDVALERLRPPIVSEDHYVELVRWARHVQIGEDVLNETKFVEAPFRGLRRRVAKKARSVKRRVKKSGRKVGRKAGKIKRAASRKVSKVKRKIKKASKGAKKKLGLSNKKKPASSSKNKPGASSGGGSAPSAGNSPASAPSGGSTTGPSSKATSPPSGSSAGPSPNAAPPAKDRAQRRKERKVAKADRKALKKQGRTGEAKDKKASTKKQLRAEKKAKSKNKKADRKKRREKEKSEPSSSKSGDSAASKPAASEGGGGGAQTGGGGGSSGGGGSPTGGGGGGGGGQQSSMSNDGMGMGGGGSGGAIIGGGTPLTPAQQGIPATSPTSGELLNSTLGFGKNNASQQESPATTGGGGGATQNTNTINVVVGGGSLPDSNTAPSKPVQADLTDDGEPEEVVNWPIGAYIGQMRDAALRVRTKHIAAPLDATRVAKLDTRLAQCNDDHIRASVVVTKWIMSDFLPAHESYDSSDDDSSSSNSSSSDSDD